MNSNQITIIHSLQKQVEHLNLQNKSLTKTLKSADLKITELLNTEIELRAKIGNLNDRILELEKSEMSNEEMIYELRKKGKVLLAHKQEITE